MVTGNLIIIWNSSMTVLHPPKNERVMLVKLKNRALIGAFGYFQSDFCVHTMDYDLAEKSSTWLW
jgi:hypothetical protein